MEPVPEILELMVPPVTVRPLATELVIPSVVVVVIPLVAIKLPPEILIAD